MNDIRTGIVTVLVAVGILVGVVMVMDSGITGKPIANITEQNGTLDAEVGANLRISIQENNIDFGLLDQGQTINSTEAGDFFTVQNDGSVDVDLAVYADSSPFTSATGGANTLPTSNFQVYGNDSATEGPATVNEALQNINSSAGFAVTVVTGLDELDSQDLATIGISVTVPVDEVSGNKDSTVTILATEN